MEEIKAIFVTEPVREVKTNVEKNEQINVWGQTEGGK